MGRRGVHPSDDARWVFNRLADAYRYRPGYPEPLIDRLAALAQDRGGVVADVGAGNGHLALPLAARGLEVYAVEPARAMLQSLETRAQVELPAEALKRLRPVHAAAEETGLPTNACGLVVVADALHWLDPERAGHEAARIRAPGGAVAVVEPHFASTPFMDEISRLLATLNPRARRSSLDAAREQLLVLAMRDSPSLERETEVFRHDLPLDDAQLEGVLRSLSFAGPALGEAAFASLLDGAREAAKREGGAVWARDLRLTTVR